MKIAFVHDWLINNGGAENVFFDIINSVVSTKSLGNSNWDLFIKDIKNNIGTDDIEGEIFTTFYNNIKFKNKSNLKINSVLSGKNIGKYYRNSLPFFPILQKKLSKKIKKYNPDIVIISSFAIAKNIDFSGKKILYLHSPMQYIYSHYDEYLNKFIGIKKFIFKFSSLYLKKWDKKFRNFDKIYFNSNYTRKLYNEIYGKNDSNNVVYPNVIIPNFKKIDIYEKYNLPKKYYLYIGRLVKFVKHLDIIIDIFNKKGVNLVVVGTGPDEEYLKSIAKKNIKFLGYIDYDTDDYWNLIINSKAVVNLTKESFGIVNYQVCKLGKTLITIDDGAVDDISGNKILLKNKEELENNIF